MVRGGAKKNSLKIDKRQWIVASVVIALLVATVSFLIWLTYTTGTKEIVAVADQFKPNPSWELVSENVRPPSTPCIDGECPSVWRQWRINTEANSSILSSALDRAGWNLKVSDECDYSSAGLGSNLWLCSATGIVDKYNVKITVRSYDSPETIQLDLNVWED